MELLGILFGLRVLGRNSGDVKSAIGRENVRTSVPYYVSALAIAPDVGSRV